MKICVLGLGYMGLPTALLLAQKHEVIGIDIDKRVVETLSKGEAPFDEAELQDLMKKSGKKLIVKTDVEEADVFIIAVPTPLKKSENVADLKYVELAAEMIYPHLHDGNLVILESTVPPNTSEKLVIPVLEKSRLEKIYYAYCPEKAIPGNTIYEMINNDRVIGGIDKKSSECARQIYSSFVRGNIHLTNTVTAEFVKLIENTYRDVNIAFANELAQMAEEVKVNVWEAIELANKHPRVNILKPGPGVGGHCIAIDPWFLNENSMKSRMISLTRKINDAMPSYLLQSVRELLSDGEDETITIFGVAYKGNVDDARETPALKLIKLAENVGYNVKMYDPYVKNFEYEILDLNDSVKDSDCIVIITNHNFFKTIDPTEIFKLMKKKNVVDSRNILDRRKWQKAGFKVKVLGNGTQ